MTPWVSGCCGRRRRFDDRRPTRRPDARLLARLKAHKAELLAVVAADRIWPRPLPGRLQRTNPGDHNARLPMRFNHLAGHSDSRRAIGPAGLRPLRAVPRFSDLVRKGHFTKRKVVDRIPAWRKKRTKLMSDQLRQAIDDSGLTRYRISKETGISETALALFYNGHRGLSMKAMNTLGEFLELKIIIAAEAREERTVGHGQHRTDYPGGKKRIQFFNPAGERKTIRLGKVSQRSAESVKYRVEQLLEALILKSAHGGRLGRVGLGSAPTHGQEAGGRWVDSQPGTQARGDFGGVHHRLCERPNGREARDKGSLAAR